MLARRYSGGASGRARDISHRWALEKSESGLRTAYQCSRGESREARRDFAQGGRSRRPHPHGDRVPVFLFRPDGEHQPQPQHECRQRLGRKQVGRERKHRPEHD